MTEALCIIGAISDIHFAMCPGNIPVFFSRTNDRYDALWKRFGEIRGQITGMLELEVAKQEGRLMPTADILTKQ